MRVVTDRRGRGKQEAVMRFPCLRRCSELKQSHVTLVTSIISESESPNWPLSWLLLGHIKGLWCERLEWSQNRDVKLDASKPQVLTEDVVRWWAPLPSEVTAIQLFTALNYLRHSYTTFTQHLVNTTKLVYQFVPGADSEFWRLFSAHCKIVVAILWQYFYCKYLTVNYVETFWSCLTILSQHVIVIYSTEL